MENAGVENAGAITYVKPKFEKKRLTVFTASKLKSLKYIIISYVECSTASYHNLWNFGTPTIMGLSPSGIYRRSTVGERSAEVHQKLTTSLSTKEVYRRKIRI